MAKKTSVGKIHPCPAFIGIQIKYWRSKKSMTQVELSKQSTVKHRHLQDIEAGRVDIKIRTLGLISSGLGVLPHVLLTPVRENQESICAHCRNTLPMA